MLVDQKVFIDEGEDIRRRIQDHDRRRGRWQGNEG